MSETGGLNDERWSRIQALLLAVQPLGPRERATYLEAACGEDASLREEVEELLAAAAGAEGYFEDLARQLEEGAESVAGAIGVDGFPSGWASGEREGGTAAAPSQEGRRLGAYRLIRLLGRGGMGSVFLAERADGQFEKRVAVKLLPMGMDSEDARARFLVERQLLAGLEHPHIARLLDGGVAEDGTPFFVLEWVEGLPIDRYSDEHRLGVEERLKLFLQVCEAVRYAHQNLVVHRDLKPSNVLVDSAGKVKLLDFGIAKLLSAEADRWGERTATRHRMLTPRFAAPEQLSGGPITTATDVYALGVLLYELLTGTAPHRRSVERNGWPELERAILEEEPTRASLAVVRSEATSRIVEARGTSADALRRRLSGDLDNILLKTLEKEPSRRYASVDRLVDDLERHRRGLPVEARPSTLGYRFVKYTRRHRVGVAATAGLAFALLGGLGAALWQAEVAARERDAARSQAARAERVTDFLVEIFRAPDPGEARGDSLTAREVLDRGRRRIEAELDADPAMQVALMEVMARTYIGLGDFAAASELAERALERRLATLGSFHPDVASSLATAGYAARWRGDPVAADSFYRRALELQERLLGPEHPDLGAILHGLALTLDATQRDSAEVLYRRGLRLLEGGDVSHRVEAGAIMGSLALLLHQRHEPAAYEEAESLYEEAVAIHRELLGESHPNTFVNLSNLAWLRQARGDYEGAARAHRELLEARRRVFGPRHYQVALTLNGLAEAMQLQGDYRTAAALNEEALSIRSELFPADHPQVLYSQHMLAKSLGSAGEFAEAEALYQDGIEKARRAGREDLTVARMINDYGHLLETRGLWEQTEEAYREAWRLYRAGLGEGHAFTAIVQGNVARLRAIRGDLDGAEALHRGALETMRKAWPDDHPTVAGAKVNLADLLLDLGRFGEAEPLLREGVEALEAALSEDHWRLAAARGRLGRCLAALGRFEEAEFLLRQAHHALSPQREAQRALWLEVNRGLAELHEARGDVERASTYREVARSEN